MAEFFFVAHKAANVDFRNGILKDQNGFRLPSLPVFIFYAIYGLVWPVLDSSLVNITDFTLSKIKVSDLY